MPDFKNPSNLQIAELLRDVAAAYELKNANSNKFRIIAYERAADAVEHASSELKDLWDEGKLEDVPGIGTSIAEHLGELFKTGKVKHFDELLQGLPKPMFELMKLPGIGPKTAYRLVSEFKITSLGQLKDLAKKGKIAELAGFGEQSQADILQTLEESKEKTRRYLLPYAEGRAKEMIEWMEKCKAVIRIDPLGSLRRQASTIGDIDLSVATYKPVEVIAHFVKFPKIQRILQKGEAKASVILPGDVQVDLMTQPPDAYGSLLQHFTGSKHHNIALRELALKQGLSLSEHGIKSTKSGNKVFKKYKDEESFYKALGLEWIPPELREDMGEIEVAQEHKLPSLVKLEAIKSDLQIHSSFNIETSHDLGENTMEQIVEKGSSLGYEYLAFTEHNPSHSKHNQKEIVDLLKRKREKVDQLNYSLACTDKGSVKGRTCLRETSARQVNKVFNSLEIDIMPDGSCPIPIEGFNYLDFALVSIHSSFTLSKEKMTQRVLSALAWHPKVKIFAHPTARKLNEREGIEIDWSKIFAYCVKNRKWIEINADPMRLDLPDFLVKEAITARVQLTLGTDAHNNEMMENMPYGVAVARRGWAETGDIINSRSLVEFEKLLKEGD